MRKLEFLTISSVVLLNVSLLTYMLLFKTLVFALEARFLIFTIQLLFKYIIYCAIKCEEDISEERVKNYLLGLFGINFIIFLSTELYLLTIPDTGIEYIQEQPIFEDSLVANFLIFYFELNTFIILLFLLVIIIEKYAKTT